MVKIIHIHSKTKIKKLCFFLDTVFDEILKITLTDTLELLFQGKMPAFMADENGWEKTHAGTGTQ